MADGGRRPIDEFESFGEIAAEHDFRQEFFVHIESWGRVRGLQRPIVVGPKGSGKTAIRRNLEDEAVNAESLFVTTLRFGSYPWRAHHSVFAKDMDDYERFTETWLFLLMVEAAKLVVAEDQAVLINDGTQAAVQDVRQFILSNWGSLTFDHGEVFRQSDYELSGKFKVPGFGEIGRDRIPRERLGDTLASASEWLMNQLATLLRRDAEYFIVFDNLDSTFRPGVSDEYFQSLVGLILAVARFEEWRRSLEAPIMPVVLLRRDIYDELVFGDKNKVSDFLLESIEWDVDPNSATSLWRMLAQRMSVLAGVPLESAWEEIFDDPHRAYARLLECSYLRPRDIIKYGNLCLAAAKGRDDGPDAITLADIEGTLPQYAKYVRAELEGEMPGHLAHWRHWLDLVRRLRSVHFTRSQFDRAVTQAPHLSKGASSDEILTVLFEFGILGYAEDGRDEQIWKHRDRDVVFDPDPVVFFVHPGLAPALGLN